MLPESFSEITQQYVRSQATKKQRQAFGAVDEHEQKQSRILQIYSQCLFPLMQQVGGKMNKNGDEYFGHRGF